MTTFWSTQRFAGQKSLMSGDYLLGRTDNRLGIIVQDNVENDEVKIEIDKSIYPDGLTHEQVLEILENLKIAGFKWESKDK